MLQTDRHQTTYPEAQLSGVISVPADQLISPEVDLALRLRGQLLLGLVRIYSIKVGHLLDDCSHAVSRLDKVRLRHSAVGHAAACS